MFFSFPVTTAGIGGMGPWEWGILLVIVLLVFGAGKLPQIGSAVGQAIKNFKKSLQPEKPGEEKKKRDEE